MPPTDNTAAVNPQQIRCNEHEDVMILGGGVRYGPFTVCNDIEGNYGYTEDCDEMSPQKNAIATVKV